MTCVYGSGQLDTTPMKCHDAPAVLPLELGMEYKVASRIASVKVCVELTFQVRFPFVLTSKVTYNIPTITTFINHPSELL